LRLLLVDLVNGEVLDSVELTLGIDEVAAAPTDAPASAGASGLSTINAFAVSQFNADYGETVEVTWDVQDAADITLQVTPRDRISEDLGAGLPETGSLTYTLPEDGIYYRVDFLLTASNSVGQSEERVFNLVMNCAVPWIFNEQHLASNCPAQPGAEVNAAHQYFEGGSMLWRVDTSEIYILGHDGRYEIFEDTWVQGEDFTSGETAPEGLIVPARGFGKVWAQNERVRNELGWAIGPESSYRMQLQDEVPVYTAYRRYLTIPGNHVIYLDFGTALAPMGTWGTVGR
jgi:hypothetical protein